MSDPRYKKLAEVLTGYSTELKKGVTVLFDRKRGAIPLVETRHSRVVREMLMGTNETHAKTIRDIELSRMRKCNAYVAVRGAKNSTENSDIPSNNLSMYSRTLRPVLNYRVNKTRWVVIRWPNGAMAQGAGMSTEAFEDFFFRVCTMDYAKMAKAQKPLIKRMANADKVHLKGLGTDLTFSIKGLGAVGCAGDRNIPDGEVFSCPVKKSVNGVIQYNTPSIYAGSRFENMRLEFKNGKIVDATASDTKRINEIFDTDPGARYVGEFSLGFNPHIKEPMCDILFDEKIAGSLHFTPGQAYEECDNGNRSAVHWDMVLIQRPEYGGGEVWFDDELIRKDGLFVPKNLKPLNPSNLK